MPANTFEFTSSKLSETALRYCGSELFQIS